MQSWFNILILLVLSLPADSCVSRPGTSAAEAESFLMSRPWFAYELVICKCLLDNKCFPFWAQVKLGEAAAVNVVRAKHWKQRGD